MSQPSVQSSEKNSLLALPDNIFKKTTNIKALDLEGINEKASIKNENTRFHEVSIAGTDANIQYQSKGRVISYKAHRDPLSIITTAGSEIQVKELEAQLDKNIIKMKGPFTIFQGLSMLRGESGQFNWNDSLGEIHKLRAKIGGIILQADRAQYTITELGERKITLTQIFITTHDVEKPATWLGFEKMEVYPGDRIKITGLSVGSRTEQYRIPIIGWIPFMHSLNPREGYIPIPGVRNLWGGYLLNNYGILLGNRRVENFMPVADYLLNTNIDYRSKRGIAFGIELEDYKMSQTSSILTGLKIYYADDTAPNTNPTNQPREDISDDRWFIRLCAIWDLADFQTDTGQWKLKTNINIVSDAYLLRDFFESESRTNDKPDNTVALTHRTKDSEQSFFTRLSLNNYYSTDRRAEWSYYRTRQPIKDSNISYETRNSIGIIEQYIPAHERANYQYELSKAKDDATRDYYMRLLNDHSYMRVSSVHEFSSQHKILEFLNITPKVGASYNGYYSVDEVGSDNRVGLYLACNIDFQIHKKYSGLQNFDMGINGITHTLRPYTSLSYHNISASNPLVPQVNSWSSSFSGSSNTPMPLDLCAFPGNDAWDTWSIWSAGLQNNFTTKYDGETRIIALWNCFININLNSKDPHNQYSSFYSDFEFTPTKRLRFYSGLQIPINSKGNQFKQSNNDISYLLTRWLELKVGHRYSSGHLIIEDANQISTNINIRFNEYYSVALHTYFDVEGDTMPIQQYSVYRNLGSWQLGATVFLRDNGGKKETGFGISFTLSESGSSFPIDFF